MSFQFYDYTQPIIWKFIQHTSQKISIVNSNRTKYLHRHDYHTFEEAVQKHREEQEKKTMVQREY